MKRIVFGGGALALLTMGTVTAHAWIFGAETNVNASTDNRRWDNSVRQSVDLNSNNHTTQESFNRFYQDDHRTWNDHRTTDDHSLSDSYKGNVSDQSISKRLGSHDIAGSVTKSMLGDIDIHVGHERADIFMEAGANENVIDTSVHSTIILGDVKE